MDLRRFKHFVRDQPALRAGALRAGALVKTVARARPGLYTLCYHHVAPAARDRFAAQLRFLRRHGAFVGPDEAAAALASGRAGSERLFLLTFDDGYADTAEVALPVLVAENVPAILFLVSDWIDHPPHRPDDPDTRLMTVADVRRWIGAGRAIGSHGATHRRFSALGVEEARDEMARSRARLAAVAGVPVDDFACPWGVADDDYRPDRDPALARACGYRSFFTTRRGRATSGADLLAMPRHVLEPEWGLYQLQSLLGGWRHGRP